MKIRMGFVSNSSSSSFVLYGACISKDEIVAFIKDKFRDQIIPWNYDDSEGLSDEDVEEGNYELEETLIKATGLDVVIDYDCGVVYIGKDPRFMTDNETMGDLKSSTVEKLKDLGLNTNDIDFFCEEINT